MRGCSATLERAQAHIQDLERRLSEFCSPEPYTVRTQEDFQDGHKVLRLIAVQNSDRLVPDVSLVLLAGEAIYQMRSALDHLIHQLVIQNGNASRLEDSKRHQFPIFDTPEGYRARSGGMIDGVSENIRRAIELEQPYKRRPYTPHDEKLWILQDLNNTDKHRLIPAAIIGIRFVKLTDSGGTFGTATSHDAVLEHNKVFMTLGNKERFYDDIDAKLRCAVAFQQAMRLNDMTVSMSDMLYALLTYAFDLTRRLIAIP